MKNRGRVFNSVSTVLLALLPLWAGCVPAGGSAKEEETHISGRVEAADGGALQGVVAIEVGRLYSKDYRFGAAIDGAGRFSTRLPKGGDYAVHIYATGYIYHPIGLGVRGGEENRFVFKVPPNQAVAEAPVISDVRFRPLDDRPGVVAISLRVEDPNGNLSHQVLGINTVSNEGFSFDPPGFVFPWTKNYPNGIYTLDYDTGGRTFDPKEWIFLAADNRCYNSPLLKYPFTLEEGVVAAHASGADRSVPLREKFEPTAEVGKKVFADNCAVCHYPDSTETRVGPGLKGLFGRELTPVEKIPVTEGNIRRRIEHGGENMPPYSHIGEPERSALILYLKSL